MKKTIGMLALISVLQANGTELENVRQFKMGFTQQVQGMDGKVTVDINPISLKEPQVITRDFYGVDSHGFSRLPHATQVDSLAFGHVKLGGNLHSLYNWHLNAVFDDYTNEIYYVYAPLERRLQFIQHEYGASPMLQVNMMGWHPDYDSSGNIVLMNTATSEVAAREIYFINKSQNLGVKNILMGNEPFHWKETHGIDIPSADEYIGKYVDYALKIRAAQEEATGNPNDVKLWGPELATGWVGWQTTHPNDCTINYVKAEKMVCSYGGGMFNKFIPYFLYKIAQYEQNLKVNPNGYKLLDYLSFHYYPLFRSSFEDDSSLLTDKNGRQNIAGMLSSVGVWDDPNYINYHDSASPKGVAPRIVDEFKNWSARFYPNVQIAVTEFGIDSVEKISYHPIVRPLYLADLMPRLANAGVSTFVKSFLQSGVLGSYNAWSLLQHSDKTPMYNVYSLISNNYVGEVISTLDNYGDMVNSYAVRSGKGVKVIIVNKDANSHASQLDLARGNENITVGGVDLPPWSVTVLDVPATGVQSIDVLQYSAADMGIAVDPYFQSQNIAQEE